MKPKFEIGHGLVVKYYNGKKDDNCLKIKSIKYSHKHKGIIYGFIETDITIKEDHMEYTDRYYYDCHEIHLNLEKYPFYADIDA